MTNIKTKSGQNKKLLSPITGLRFFAAGAIVLHHLPGTFGITGTATHGYMLAHGVSLFFVLSGFVMMYSYPSLDRKGDVPRFLINRIARIWPSHVAVLAFSIMALNDFHADTFVTNLLLIHSWFPQPNHFFGYNAVSWSISTELGFYLAFPLLLFGFRRYPTLTVLASFSAGLLMVGLSVRLGIPPYERMTNTAVMQGFVMTNPLARLFEFTIGVAAAEIWLRTNWRLPSSPIFWTLAEFACLGLLIFNITMIFTPIVGFFPASEAMTAWLAMSISPALPAALLMICLAVGRGIVSYSLARPIIVYLGEISFSIYMTHFVILPFFHHPPLVDWPQSVQLASYFTIVLVASAVLHTFVERPAQRLIKAIAGTSKPLGVA